LSAACPSGAAIYAQVLALSLGLAVLSFYLGITLVSIPTWKNRRLKSAGYMMMMDGAAYIVFMAIINSIGLFMSLALSLLTGAPVTDPLGAINSMYAGYDHMVNPEGPFRLTLIRIYTAVGNYLNAYAWIPVVGAAQARMHWSLVNPVLQLLNMTQVVTMSLFFLGKFIRCAWLSFVAFGALVYGLPARIGRRLGAGLIATMLVFYVGLPFMPSFVGTAEQPRLLELPDIQRSENMTRFYLNDSARLLLEAGQANTKYVTYMQSNIRFNVEQGYLPDGTKLEGGYSSNYLIQLTNGSLTWKLWTDVDGSRVYRLPVGNYLVTGIQFIGQWLRFQGGQSVRIDEQSNVTVPIQLHIYGVRAAFEGREVEGYIDLEQTQVRILSVSRDPTGVSTSFTVTTTGWGQQLVAYYDERADLRFFWEEPCTQAGTTVTCGLSSCETFATMSNVGGGASRWSIPGRIDCYPSCPCGNCTLCNICDCRLPQTHILTIKTSNIPMLVELPAVISKKLVDEDPVLGPQLAYFQGLAKEGISSLRELSDYAARVAMEMILAPLLFILLLGLIAAGIARALGGGGGLPIPGLG
jgi:hypothetical protein